jgi:hypothetical protein
VIRNITLLSLLIFIVGGCAAYKELKPKPEISFLENGYIEILDKDEKFELKKEKKYFIKFPPPQNENNYLVLEMLDIDLLNAYLTRTFDDGKGDILGLPDASPDKSRLSVYALDRTSPVYFWVIDRVAENRILDLKYRYVAQWRFRFETRHDAFEKILEENRLAPKHFETIGIDMPAERIDFDQQMAQTKQKSENIKQVQSQLQEIEAIFPATILNSQDAAYLSYLELKSDIDKELQFQNNYITTLSLLKIAVDPKRNTREFINAVPSFLTFLQDTTSYPENARHEAKRIVVRRFQEILLHFKKVLLEKNDIESIAFNMENILKLYTLCDVTPDDNLNEAANYIKTFNRNTDQVKTMETELKAVKNFVKQGGPWPGDNLYTEARSKLSQLRFSARRTELESFKTFQTYRCSYLMNEAIKNTQNELAQLREGYQRADYLVPQINSYKQQQEYRQIIRLLKENPDLTFLIEQYPDVDQRSLDQQKKRITSAITRGIYHEAEQYLNGFYNDSYFLRLSEILPLKNRYVEHMEDTLYTLIKQESLQNAQAFIDQNKERLTMIDSLYADPAFQPVYNLTFTSGSGDRLIARKEALSNQLNTMQHITFPATAIEQIYQDFVANINKNGVAKAHAIIQHSKKYQGSDRNIKNLIAECDPSAAKWLTKIKDYRKLFVIPISPQASGKNKYMFKINIQIPSEAKFPVFDINIKLPEEIARNAAQQQWYEKMDFNGKLLKNEGRFTILAPTRENGYECKITPLQVEKTGNNILEVTFTHPSFRVFEISVMGQKPIIRKN